MSYLALIVSATPIFLALLGMTWRMSGLATKLTEALENNKATTAKLEARLEVLEQIPLLERDVQALKEAISKTTSMLPKLDARMQVVESKIISLKEYRSPYRSKPEFEDK